MADPFSLGVASGDPLPDGLVLWTRLAPDPLNGGGMPPHAVTVKWEIAADEQMKEIVQRGSAMASPELGHSVHVEVKGLKPARWYWYRFMTGDAVSPVGRTRAAPALSARLDRLRFAFASCQHYETGFFTAYKHMADEQLDLVLHLGDYMPLRRSSLPRGSDLRLYRRLRFGDLAEFNVLDTRQYRSNQPCGDGNKPLCPEAINPKATMMGAEQERWLFNNLDRSKALWNVIAQQVMMARWDSAAGSEQRLSMDKWSAYPAALNRFLNYLRERKPSNPVVLTGDIHSNWVADIKADFDDPGSAVVGTEFVGTSITSGGNGMDMRPDVERQMGENPHIKFFNGQRGYVRCDVNSKRWQTDFRILAAVAKPDEPISTRASFVVENGKPGTVSA